MKQIKYSLMILFVLGDIILSQPKLSLSKTEMDLGVIYKGLKKEGKIVLKNIGTDTLRIYSVRPFCGCTAVKNPKDMLLPNESDEMAIEFNSANYYGKVEKYINIRTNDPTAQDITVKLIAEIKQELKSTSNLYSVLFGEIQSGKNATKNISLVNISDHKIRIKSSRVSTPIISLKMNKNLLRPNDTLKIDVTVKPDTVLNLYRYENFTIETDSKNQSNIEIRVTYRCPEGKMN
jgi:hypothetical protein